MRTYLLSLAGFNGHWAEGDIGNVFKWAWDRGFGEGIFGSRVFNCAWPFIVQLASARKGLI